MIGTILTILLTAVAPPFEAHALDGRTISGTPTELTADRLVLETSEGRVSLDTADLLTLSAGQRPLTAAKSPGPVVELIDGSTIHAREYLVRDGRALISLADGRVLEAPISAVESVRLQDDSLSAQWARLTEGGAAIDLLIVRTNGSLDSHQGVLHEVGEDTIGFDIDGEILPVRRSKVYGFVYRHGAGQAPPPPICRVSDAAGSRWAARSVNLADELQWVTSAGLSVSQPLENILRIDFSRGKLLYLGDLEAESSIWTPYFGGRRPLPALRKFYAPRFNRGFDGEALMLDGAKYDKGLALHARTELVYRLPEGFSRFRALVGPDDSKNSAGKARLIVRGDDRVLLEADFAGDDKPKAVELDVAGLRRLTIMVDFGDRSGAGARLLLCNARIVK